jgi:hypothetical protein
MGLHIVNTKRMAAGEFVSTLQPEAASACSEIGSDDEPKAQTVTTWMRVKRWIRAQAIKRLRP